MKKRLPLFVMLAIGAVLWRGGFGFLGTERTLTWRFPVSYPEVRRFEVQVWDGDELIKRQELAVSGGLRTEPTSRVLLTRGEHRAVGVVWFADGGQQTFQRAFDPAMQEDVVVAFER